jgi:peptidoglycan/xylan/chitin deacetylase (PgdA/CDA1 family)
MHRLLLTRSARRRLRARRTVAVLLTAALGATAAAVAVVAAGSAPAPRHPLVASSSLQPAPAETPTPDATADATPESDGAAEPDDITVAATTAATPAPPPGPRHDSAPGHVQGGAAPPPPPAAGPSVSVPILLYHYIRINPVARDGEGFRLSVTPSNFAQQMALLTADGVHTASLDEVMQALAGGPPLPTRSVVLTFDDGHDDFAYRAVPVLQSYGFTATSFVVPGFLGKSSYMTLDQLHAVVSAGMTIGAHTMHHVDLAAVAPAVAADEITRSRAVLQQLTGQPVADFAYPYGIFTNRVVAMVRQAGFTDASTTEWGSRQYASQPFLLRRMEVGGYDSLSSFAQKAGVPPPPKGWVATSPSPRVSPSPSDSPSPSPSPSESPSPEPSATPRHRHSG